MNGAKLVVSQKDVAEAGKIPAEARPPTG